MKGRPDRLPRSGNGWRRKVIGAVETGRASRILVSVDTDEVGQEFLSVRKWVAKKGDATMTPTKSGVAIPMAKAKEVMALFSQATE